MNKIEVSTHETLIINTLLHYKFLTLSQLCKLLKLEITAEYIENMQDKQMLKALKNRNFQEAQESLYFALPNRYINIEEDLYFQDIDLRKLSISQEDYFHIYHTVNYHILFDTYTQYKQMKVNYFSSYFDEFKNKTKKDELQASGKFMLESGEHLIPNATMNFSLDSGQEYIYVLELFSDSDVQHIVERIRQYNQLFVENIYKLDRVIFIFKNEATREEGTKYILEADILSEYKNNFIFKTIENLENDFSFQWMNFNSSQKLDFVMLEEESIEADIEEIVPIEKTKEEEKTTPTLEEKLLHTLQKNNTILKEEIQKLSQKFENSQEIKQEIPVEEKEEEIIPEVIQEKSDKFLSRAKIIKTVQDSSLLLYTLAGIAAFIVSAYMEMIAFDSFYPGFILISVVMVIAFEVAKVGSIFMKVYIKKSGSEVNKWTLKVLSSLFIPLLFGLSIISSMAVTADKLESPHAEELKAKSIKKIQTEYEEIVALTEKDHLRRAKQLKQDFFEKITEFEMRKKEVIANKDAEIEKQKTVYGADGKTWKGSKYEEHIKERKNLITEFATERMALEHLYNQQIEQESKRI